MRGIYSNQLSILSFYLSVVAFPFSVSYRCSSFSFLSFLSDAGCKSAYNWDGICAVLSTHTYTHTHTHTSFPPALLATQHSGLSTAPINKTEMSVSPWRPHRPCGQWSKVSPCLRPLCVFEEVKDAQKRSHSGYLAMKVHLKGPFSQKISHHLLTFMPY